MLFLVNHKFTVCHNKYEYVCPVVVYSIQVYSKPYNLQQIATEQSVSYYTLHGFVAFVFFVQYFLSVQLQK